MPTAANYLYIPAIINTSKVPWYLDCLKFMTIEHWYQKMTLGNTNNNTNNEDDDDNDDDDEDDNDDDDDEH